MTAILLAAWHILYAFGFWFYHEHKYIYLLKELINMQNSLNTHAHAIKEIQDILIEQGIAKKEQVN